MKRMTSLRLLLAVSLFAGMSFQITEAQSVAGDWYGLAEIQGFPLRLNIHITETNGVLSGTFDSPDQGALGIPLTGVSFEAPAIKLIIPNC